MDHRSRCCRCAALLLLVSVAASAHAQEPPPSEERTVPPVAPTVVVGDSAAEGSSTAAVTSPNRVETPRDQIGSSLTVITSEDIARRGVTSVAEALRGVPGLDVVQQGPSGGLTSVFLRGGNSQHTKVVIDGIPVNDPSSASRAFDFSTLSVDNIERIEVLRGPQSTVWGSDAMGGVISITTKRGRGPLAVQSTFLGGSFGTARESLGLSGGNDLVYYAFSGSYLHTDGFSAAARRLGNTERDAFDLGTLSGRFGAALTQDVELEYSFRWADARAEIDDASFSVGVPPTDDLFRLNLSETFFSRVQARWNALDGLLANVVGFNLADYDRTDTDDFFPSQFLGQTRKVEWIGTAELASWNTFTAGADYLHEQATQFSSFGDAAAAQFNGGVWLQDKIGLGDRWFTTFGHRWDDHSAAGPAATYRLATIFHLYETGTAFKGSLGTGFRAPSLAENLFPFGNPNLLPETSRGWDYGVEQTFCCRRLTLGVSHFRNDFRNLVQFDFGSFTLENIGRAKASGLELYGAARLNPCTDLSFAYTRTDTLDYETGLPLLRRPRDKASLTLGRYLACRRAYLQAQLLAVGSRLDARDGSVVLGDYVTLNVAAHYDLTPQARLLLRLDNLTNTQYEEVFGYETADLSAYGALQLNW